MTISPPDVLIGSQRPRVCSLPPSTVSSAGAEAVELAATAGLVLDDWQAWALEQSLGLHQTRAGGAARWAAEWRGRLATQAKGPRRAIEDDEGRLAHLLAKHLR